MARVSDAGDRDGVGDSGGGGLYTACLATGVLWRTTGVGTRIAAQPIEPISIPERCGAVLLLGATLAVGLYPRLLLDWIVPALQSEMFQGVVKGGGW
jgi:hypothetical protein